MSKQKPTFSEIRSKWFKNKICKSCHIDLQKTSIPFIWYANLYPNINNILVVPVVGKIKNSASKSLKIENLQVSYYHREG